MKTLKTFVFFHSAATILPILSAKALKSLFLNSKCSKEQCSGQLFFEPSCGELMGNKSWS